MTRATASLVVDPACYLFSSADPCAAKIDKEKILFFSLLFSHTFSLSLSLPFSFSYGKPTTNTYLRHPLLPRGLQLFLRAALDHLEPHARGLVGQILPVQVDGGGEAATETHVLELTLGVVDGVDTGLVGDDRAGDLLVRLDGDEGSLAQGGREGRQAAAGRIGRERGGFWRGGRRGGGGGEGGQISSPFRLLWDAQATIINIHIRKFGSLTCVLCRDILANEGGVGEDCWEARGEARGMDTYRDWMGANIRLHRIGGVMLAMGRRGADEEARDELRMTPKGNDMV